MGAGLQVLGILLQELQRERPSFCLVKRGVQIVQQIVGQCFGMTGARGQGHVISQNADACGGSCLERFVLPMYAAVRMDLEQTFYQQNGEGVPVSKRREIRPFAKVSHMVQRRI